MKNSEKKVVVGMSGGVDSSLSAALLVEQGYKVQGVYLDCWEEPGCKADPNRKDAIKVALKLGIPIKILDFKKEYKKRVIDWLYSEFKKGRTPNPDVMCNKEIKFGLLLDWSKKQGFDYLATGHYARFKEGKLLKGKDRKKDQTYFLAMVEKQSFERVMFPIGEIKKEEVRLEAKKRGLQVWDKKGSSGICFIGHQISFQEFLRNRVKEHEGEVIDMRGRLMGKHKGHEFYTIGQRHGFLVKQRSIKSQPWYVVRKEAKTNRLIVGRKNDLERQEFEVEGWQWIDKATSGDLRCRIRHGGRLIKCEIKEKKVRLKEPELGVAEGQVAVIYRGEECLGGGIISD